MRARNYRIVRGPYKGAAPGASVAAAASSVWQADVGAQLAPAHLVRLAQRDHQLLVLGRHARLALVAVDRPRLQRQRRQCWRRRRAEAATGGAAAEPAGVRAASCRSDVGPKAAEPSRLLTLEAAPASPLSSRASAACPAPSPATHAKRNVDMRSPVGLEPWP